MKSILFNILVLCGAFLVPLKTFSIAISILVLIDLITAIIRDIKLKKRIISKKLRKTATKLFLYLLFIVASFILFQVTFNHTFYVENFVFGSLAIVELKSIGENMSIATDNDLFTKIIKKITKKLTNKIDNLF